MSLLMKGGISNLSELTIDAAPDKAKAIADLILTIQGDMLYRNTLAERLAAEYGVGMNFLHMTNSGEFVPVWKDLQADIVYITGAVNRVIYAPILQIPVPVLSLVAAEDHSGGGFTATPPLTIPAPSIGLITAEDHSGGGFAATPPLTIPDPPTLALYPALLDQKYQTGDDAEVPVYGINWEAQTFTPSFNHDLNILWLKIARNNYPGNVTVSLRDTLAGIPAGLDLQSVTINGDYLSTTTRLIMFLITAQAVVAATQYAIVIRAPAGDAANYIKWREDASAPGYAGGTRCQSTNSGGDWAIEVGEDYIFEEGNYI